MRFFLKVSVMISFLFTLNFNLHSQIIFQESFNSPNGTTSGTAFGINWSSSCPTCLSGDYWEVRSNVFEANDTNGEAEWITDNSIDISNCEFVEISFNIQNVGTMEACGTGCNSADFIVFQYNVDGTGWTNPSNSSFCGGSCAGVNVVAAGNAGSITYTTGCIPASGNGLRLRIAAQCWAAAEYWRIDNITVTCSSPDAGTNGNLTICSSANPTNLFNQLGGTPDNGGTWSGPSALTGGSLGTFNPGTMNPGTYTYTVGTAPCQVSADVVVTAGSVNAGTNGTMSINCGPVTDDLLPYIGGNPDLGGVWTGPSAIPSNDPDGNFDPLTMLPGVYTYTVGTAPCQASSTVTVTILNNNNAGSNGAISVCSTSNPVNLFNQLGGTPNNGGTWSGPSSLTGGALGTFNPATMNAGTYTYTVGTAPCQVSANVIVTIGVVNAGTNGTMSINCGPVTDDLLPYIGGNPDSGGVWTGPSPIPSNDPDGNFDPLTMLPGVYTYTVGTAPCQASSTVTVTILNNNNAGSNGAISVCSTSNPVNLFNQLGGTPDNGGTWSGPSALTGGSLGTFNPGTMNPGTYTYTVGTAPCQVSADVVVTAGSVNAGTNGTMSINCGPVTDDLLPYIGGNPDLGGVWTGPSAIPSNDPDGNFDPLTMLAGVYTYTVGTAPCQASSTVTVTILNNNNAGSNGAISVCSTSNPVNLFNQLGGTPDNGGTWSGPSALTGGSLGTFNPGIMNPGTYTYTVGTAPCQVSANVIVTIGVVNAGTNGTMSINCGPVTDDLLPYIGGNPDPGGVWTGPSAIPSNDPDGNFDPLTMLAGVYTYTVGTAPCQASSTVTVTILNNNNAGSNGTISMCANATPVNLFSQLGGTPDNSGTWSGPSVLTSGALGTFNPATMNAGTYTYTVGTSPCNVSATVTVTINSLGNAGNNATINLCSNSTILNLLDELGGTPDNGGIWSGPSALTGGDLGTFNPSIMSAGVYTYTVGTAPCTIAASVTVNINPLDNASFTTNNYCEGGNNSNSIVVTVLTGGTFSFNPLPANGATINPMTGLITNGLGGTIYSIQYTTNGACPQSSTQTIEIYGLPNVQTGNHSICVGNSVTLNASGAFSYTWDNGLGNGQNHVVSPNATTTYSVTGTTIYGCQSTRQSVVTVIPLPNINAGADQTICEGESASLNASGGDNYFWTNGVSNGTPFYPANSSTYVVTGVDANGCQNMDSVNITIESKPVPSFFSNNLAGCAPFTTSFINNTLGNYSNCQWSINGNVLNSCDSVSYTFNSSGLYGVTLTLESLNGCIGGTAYPNYIYVQDNPVADFSFTQIEMNEINTEASFVNESTGASSYVWSFGDGNESTEYEPTHNYNFSDFTSYMISLVAISDNGCRDSTELEIIKEETLIYYVPNSFTPDGNEFNNTFSPVFTEGFDPYDYQLTIYNRWGELIFESRNAEIGWDGTSRNGMQTNDVYTWKIDFKLANSGERISKTGHVNLLK